MAKGKPTSKQYKFKVETKPGKAVKPTKLKTKPAKPAAKPAKPAGRSYTDQFDPPKTMSARGIRDGVVRSRPDEEGARGSDKNEENHRARGGQHAKVDAREGEERPEPTPVPDVDAIHDAKIAAGYPSNHPERGIGGGDYYKDVPDKAGTKRAAGGASPARGWPEQPIDGPLGVKVSVNKPAPPTGRLDPPTRPEQNPPTEGSNVGQDGRPLNKGVEGKDRAFQNR